MMKKIVSMVLAFVLMLGVCAFASDTPSDWAAPEINPSLPERFVSVGAELDYQRPATRAEFSMFAMIVFEKLNGGLPAMQAQGKFQDVGSEMIDIFVLMASAVGIVNGVSETEFMPKNPLTRQELCTMLARIFKQTDPEYANVVASASIDKFADAATVSDWASDAMKYCVAKGIIQGVSETELSPLTTVSVEQAMVITSRIIK